jgi:hypothetical protein
VCVCVCVCVCAYTSPHFLLWPVGTRIYIRNSYPLDKSKEPHEWTTHGRSYPEFPSSYLPLFRCYAPFTSRNVFVEGYFDSLLQLNLIDCSCAVCASPTHSDFAAFTFYAYDINSSVLPKLCSHPRDTWHPYHSVQALTDEEHPLPYSHSSHTWNICPDLPCSVKIFVTVLLEFQQPNIFTYTENKLCRRFCRVPPTAPVMLLLTSLTPLFF